MKLPQQKIKTWKQFGGAVLDALFVIATIILIFGVTRMFITVGGA